METAITRTKRRKRFYLKKNPFELFVSDNCLDYDDAMLDRIFDRTVAEELKLREDEPPTVNSDVNSKQGFHEQSLIYLEKSKEVIREKMQAKTIFYKAGKAESGKPMFDTTWRALMAAFSVVFEETDVRPSFECLMNWINSLGTTGRNACFVLYWRNGNFSESCMHFLFGLGKAGIYYFSILIHIAWSYWQRIEIKTHWMYQSLVEFGGDRRKLSSRLLAYGMSSACRVQQMDFAQNISFFCLVV